MLRILQHWGIPKRLLDFTLSLYVALFFALILTDSQASHVAIWAPGGSPPDASRPPSPVSQTSDHRGHMYRSVIQNRR
jgi:hypothetical protein